MHGQLLVVEDDAVLQLSLSAMLRREGYTIHAAAGVGEARALLLQIRPAVVLLDLALPAGGLDLIGELRGLADAPLAIAITGDDGAAAVEAFRLGAFDCLPRPINNELLRAAARRAVEHYGLRQQARELERLRAAAESLRDNVRATAHHISQHLTVIMGETQLLQEELADADALAGLERILRATEQAARSLAALRATRPLAPREGDQEPGQP